MARRSNDMRRLAAELAGLPDLPVEELRRRWREVFDADPPERIGARLLARGLAHGIQERTLGELKPATARYLDKVAASLADGRSDPVPAPAFKPGTRLLREWRGETHEVTLLETGVLYRGERLRSLSEVARRITGTRWNGPRFFGMRSDKTEAGHVAA